MNQEFRFNSNTQFGNGNSAEKFMHIFSQPGFWDIKIQKKFNDFK